jgi:hypothetical protein
MTAKVIEELAAEAGILAENLVGVDRDAVAKILDDLSAQTERVMRSHGLGRKPAKTVATAFVRLVRRHWVELQVDGFHNGANVQ